MAGKWSSWSGGRWCCRCAAAALRNHAACARAVCACCVRTHAACACMLAHVHTCTCTQDGAQAQAVHTARCAGLGKGQPRLQPAYLEPQAGCMVLASSEGMSALLWAHLLCCPMGFGFTEHHSPPRFAILRVATFSTGAT